MQPFITIGVTVYKRREFLRDCLQSILAQGFSDFEVLVGNDCPEEVFLPEEFGANDPRIRFINRKKNLGEHGNMNQLLNESKGRYFSWLADDDVYHPRFLDSIHSALRQYQFPPCIFTSYLLGDGFSKVWDLAGGSPQMLTGREFLRGYLKSQLLGLGCYAVWETKLLQKLGGMQRLGSGFSPYSDNLLTLQAGLLKEVVYVHQPLIYFRTHETSLSWSSTNLEAYISAQEGFCEKALEIFKTPQLFPDLQGNLYNLLTHWCVEYYFGLLKRMKSKQLNDWNRYSIFIGRQAKELGLFRIKFLIFVLWKRIKFFIRQIAARPPTN